MYFYVEEGGTPIPYMGAHWRHLENTISNLNYLLRRRCGLMSNYFDNLFYFQSSFVVLNAFCIVRTASFSMSRFKILVCFRFV